MPAYPPPQSLVLLADGSAASPSLAFASNPNTGFYKSSTNNVGVAGGGSQRAIVGASGAVFSVVGLPGTDGSLDLGASTNHWRNIYLKPVTSANIKVGGIISVLSSTVGNLGAGEDDLSSYSVPAALLNVNGDSLTFEAAGTITSNVNAKRLRVRFGATVIFDSGAAGFPISAALNWTIAGRIIRTGAATQKALVSLTTNNASLAAYASYATATETLSGAVTLKLTGEAVSDNDIVQELMTVCFEPNP
jgi:hypothetical protein